MQCGHRMHMQDPTLEPLQAVSSVQGAVRDAGRHPFRLLCRAPHLVATQEQLAHENTADAASRPGDQYRRVGRLGAAELGAPRPVDVIHRRRRLPRRRGQPRELLPDIVKHLRRAGRNSRSQTPSCYEIRRSRSRLRLSCRYARGQQIVRRLPGLAETSRDLQGWAKVHA